MCARSVIVHTPLYKLHHRARSVFVCAPSCCTLHHCACSIIVHAASSSLCTLHSCAHCHASSIIVHALSSCMLHPACSSILHASSCTLPLCKLHRHARCLRACSVILHAPSLRVLHHHAHSIMLSIFSRASLPCTPYRCAHSVVQAPSLRTLYLHVCQILHVPSPRSLHYHTHLWPPRTNLN